MAYRGPTRPLGITASGTFPTEMAAWRVTRRAALAGGVAAIAGVVAARFWWLDDGDTGPGCGEPGVDTVLGWGSDWVAPHWLRAQLCDGRRSLVVPRGLAGTAPDQPIPVFLQDQDLTTGTLELGFRVTRGTLRPGVLFAAVGPFDFRGVTVERDRLVLAEYGREERRVLGSVKVPLLRTGIDLRLRVEIAAARVRAVLWPDGEEQPAWQLDAGQSPRIGAHGVLAVHPTDLRRAELEVLSFDFRAPEGVSATPPVCPVAITGPPEPQRDGGYAARIQVWSGWPATVVFERGHSPTLEEAEEIAAVELDVAPFVARAIVESNGGRPVYWRARLLSRTSELETLTPVHVLRPPVSERPLVLLAASCAHHVGPPPNEGLARLAAAAPEPAALLVYQGDLGYPNNDRWAAYSAAEDFFADRFQRLLARPDFTAIRREVPLGFTLDDHDYGPPNNANRERVQPWAVALWNQIHADPSERGYFDTRIGDVHCLTLDVRRYADPVQTADGPEKTRLGGDQLEWLEQVLRESDAGLFVVFSGGTFARRYNLRDERLVDDTFVFGWPDEYDRLLGLFGEVQADGRRVLVVSGDAHGMRIHRHPDPARELTFASTAPVVEFICSGLRAALWSASPPDDPTVDSSRNVLGFSGAGLVVVDPPQARRRRITLRAVGAGENDPVDLFPPLSLPFEPAGG
jgi:PhoD-like phosphatase